MKKLNTHSHLLAAWVLPPSLEQNWNSISDSNQFLLVRFPPSSSASVTARDHMYEATCPFCDCLSADFRHVSIPRLKMEEMRPPTSLSTLTAASALTLCHSEPEILERDSPFCHYLYSYSRLASGCHKPHHHLAIPEANCGLHLLRKSGAFNLCCKSVAPSLLTILIAKALTFFSLHSLN